MEKNRKIGTWSRIRNMINSLCRSICSSNTPDAFFYLSCRETVVEVPSEPYTDSNFSPSTDSNLILRVKKSSLLN